LPPHKFWAGYATVRKLVSCVNIFSPAQHSTYETNKKLRTAAKIKTQDYKIEPN